MHKTTINLRADVWLRLRNRAERDGVSVASLVNELLADALTSGDGGAGVLLDRRRRGGRG